MAARVHQLEEALVADLFYVFQGLDGSVFRYSTHDDRYVLELSVAAELPCGYKSLALQLCELGWAHRRCAKYLEEFEVLYQKKDLGSIGQAIKEELNEYYKAIAAMDAHNRACTDLANKLTLKRVFFWSREPLQHIKILCAFMETCKSRGPGLLGSVFEFSMHGNPAYSNLFKRLLHKASIPLYNIILTWVFEGSIEDPFKEFFVKDNQMCSDSHEDLWHKKYYLPYTSTGDVQNLPPFISVNVAEAILRVGKSINFMKSCHRQNFFENEDAIIQQEAKEELMNPNKEITEHTFTGILTKVSGIIDSMLLDMVLKEYHFMDHVEAVKSYMFLGRDDWADHIISGIERELDKPVASVYRHNIALLIDRVLRTPSNLAIEKIGILENLRFVLDVPESQNSEDGASLHGWDVFSLDYAVIAPLDAIFTPSVTALHHQISYVMWRVRRAYHYLNKLWRMQVDSLQKLKSVFEAQPVLHRSYLLQQEMRSFISNFMYFVNYSVIHSSWKSFKAAVESSVKSLGELYEEYQKWVEHISEFLIFGNRDQRWNECFEMLLDVITQFYYHQNELYTNALSIAALRKAQVAQANLDVLEIKDNILEDTSDDAETEEEKKFRRNLNQVYAANFNKVYKEFKLLLAKLGFLKEHKDGDLIVAGVKELSVNLNFNNFYKKAVK